MTTQPKILFTAKVHTTGGREGAAHSSDGRLDIKLSSPGSPGGGTNPEQVVRSRLVGVLRRGNGARGPQIEDHAPG